MRLLAALLVFIAGSALAATDVELIAGGRAALERGDLDQAIPQLEKAAALKPDSYEAHYLLAGAYGRKAQNAGIFGGGMSLAGRVRDEYLRALEIDPNSIDARMHLIDFYIIAPGIVGGSDEKAMAQAAEIKKRDALDGHRAYARIYALQKKYDLGVKEMSEATREQPKSAKAHYFLGNAYLNGKDLKGSLAEYEAALALDDAYMPAYYRIAQLSVLSESNYVRGEEAVRKYLAYKPTDEQPGLGGAWYWLGMIQEKQGRKSDALQSYLNAQELAPDLKELSEALKRVK